MTHFIWELPISKYTHLNVLVKTFATEQRRQWLKPSQYNTVDMLLICCCSLIPQKVRRVCLACLLILTSGLLSLTLSLRRQRRCTIASQRYQFSILILDIHICFTVAKILFVFQCYIASVVSAQQLWNSPLMNQSCMHFRDWLKKKSLMQINVTGALFILAKVAFFANWQLFMWLNIAFYLGLRFRNFYPSCRFLK